jgi:RNA polymerase sigma factor (sigma-70 family)
MTAHKSDNVLWTEILNGDAKAWEKLVKRYQALLFAVSTRMGLSQADAADCFQQTWALLFQNRSRLRNPGRISAWLVTTIKREALHLKLKKSGKHYPSENKSKASPTNSETGLSNPRPLPDEEIEMLERQAQLEIALKEIGGRCQELLEAMFFSPEEKSYADIAKSLGMSSNSIGPLRKRCLEKLKAILEKNNWI